MTLSPSYSREGGNPEQLITENLDVWSSAIKHKSTTGRGSSKKIDLYGIKKLRELILELAVRGMIVPQNANDEPASVLLEKIEAERLQLVKEKKIKKPKKLPEISDDEKVGSLPEGWEYARLNDLGEWGAGATPRRGNAELYGGSIPWFKSGELVGDYISVSEETVTELALKKSSLRLNKVGDVLLAMYGATIGKTSILSVAGTTNQAVCACTPFEGFTNTFLLTLLKAYKPRFVGMGAGGAQPNISREKIIATVIALPPESEQPRIVAKVDELMALCDQLEQQQENSISAHQTLVETLLAALTNAGEKGEFNQAWARIAEHFDTLFTTEHSIDQLKQTILQLAVMGKLVPQDPNDEPASVLLEKIGAEKAQLVKDGKIKKQKALPEIGEGEKPFELPEGWEWCRLPDIGDLARGKSKHRPRNDRALYVDGNIPLVQTGDVSRANGVIETYTALYNKTGLAQSRLWPKGTMCITIAANIADTSVLGFDACFPDSVVGYTPFDKEIDVRYFEFFIRTAKSDLEKYAPSTAQKNINLEILSQVLIPFPPKAELSRVVAKVVKLMDLCDTLKARIRESQTTQFHLADAMAEQAIN